MNGAEHLLGAAKQSGIEVCFANPGTTELQLVAALDSVPIRTVLGLAEGVCAGAADGYGRMADKPAMTLLHLGPGLANALSNLHNARRGRTPVVNVVGDHPLWHKNADPPLASDIEALARTVSTWVRTTHRPADCGRDMMTAAREAAESLGVATLVVPADCQSGNVEDAKLPTTAARARGFSQKAVDHAVNALRRSGQASALLLGGAALREEGLKLAAQMAEVTGCQLMCTRLPARIERGSHLPVPARLGYYADQLVRQFENLETVVLAGSTAPVAFFAEAEQTEGGLLGNLRFEHLARPEEDVTGALEALVDATGARPFSQRSPQERPGLPSGRLNAENLGITIAALQPEDAIVVDESITLVRARQSYFAAAAACPPHSLLSLTGGAIGMGIPCATGAAVACPERPVISIQADGSALYSIQGLWSQARESLNVTTVICSNRRYEILRNEMARAGHAELGLVAQMLTDLSRPVIDFVAIARGFGIPGNRCDTVDGFAREFRRALAEPGPHLIEVLT